MRQRDTIDYNVKHAYRAVLNYSPSREHEEISWNQRRGNNLSRRRTRLYVRGTPDRLRFAGGAGFVAAKIDLTIPWPVRKRFQVKGGQTEEKKEKEEKEGVNGEDEEEEEEQEASAFACGGPGRKNSPGTRQ